MILRLALFPADPATYPTNHHTSYPSNRKSWLFAMISPSPTSSPINPPLLSVTIFLHIFFIYIQTQPNHSELGTLFAMPYQDFMSKTVFHSFLTKFFSVLSLILIDTTGFHFNTDKLFKLLPPTGIEFHSCLIWNSSKK